MHYQLTYTVISHDGNVARLHLACGADRPVAVTLGKAMQIPVLRREGRYDRQQADWQMGRGHGSDWVTIRCGQDVAFIAWSDGRLIQRSGNLPVSILNTFPVASVPLRASIRIA
jgi:hypothetical protein